MQIIFSSSVVASLQGFAAFASCIERRRLTRCAPSKTNVSTSAAAAVVHVRQFWQRFDPNSCALACGRWRALHATKLIVSRISKHKSEESFIISKDGKKPWANITPTETTCIANEKLLRNIMMRTQTPFKH
jgi:hypothetical protein